MQDGENDIDKQILKNNKTAGNKKDSKLASNKMEILQDPLKDK